MHRDTIWAQKLIAMQDEETMWGGFHSLAVTNPHPVTTEQAMRRLQVLGYTMEDECIQKAVRYLDDCLVGRKQIPDRTEKLHDWTLFTHLMFSAWIRRFTRDNEAANAMAKRWAQVVTAAFQSGAYSHEAYMKAYAEVFGMKPKGGRLIDFVQFYVISILAGELDWETESALVRYVLQKLDGMYYVYEGCIGMPPDVCDGKRVSRYLGAIELLAEYEGGREHLSFVIDWLMGCRQIDGRWDFGSGAKDGVYFPLSNDWRKRETRIADCTERVEKLIAKIMK